MTDFLVNTPDHEELHRALGKRFAQLRSEDAQRTMSGLEGYAETPLVSLPSLAESFGIELLCLKDESSRFGLGSFKALGGAYALARQLSRLIDEPADEILAGGHRGKVGSFTVTTATAGNHGRSVAWGAELCGCKAVIFVPDGAHPQRAERFRAHGADVVAVPGTFDDAVREADRIGGEHGWVHVADTSRDNYTEIPTDVMHGYTLMMAEVVRQWPTGGRPTHIFVQCGVGGLAAAVLSEAFRAWSDAPPRFFVVEPDQAASMMASVRAGRLMKIEGEMDTVMSCLACGEPSLIPFELLRIGANGFMTVTDAEEKMAIAAVAQRGILLGDSGAAGLAGLAKAASHYREETGLNGDSRVLLFGTEGPLT